MNADPLALRAMLPGMDSASPASRTGPIEVAPSGRLAEYLALHGSTTFFLQTVSGHPVEVDVVRQSIESHPERGEILRRHSRLYVRHARNIILVAEASISLSRLAADQRQRLIERTEGIGKLLDPDNLGLLEKRDIETLRVPAPPGLQTTSDWAISRYFALAFNGVHCGEIRETLNEESLERAR
jgi:chorismate-pyruvate lyase